MSAGNVKPGTYILIDNVACVVKDIQKSKTGKHGASKCRIEAVGLIKGEKKIALFSGSDNVEVPIIEKKTAQVLSIHGDLANVMEMTTFETMDLKIPEELKDRVKEGEMVSYWIIMDEKVMMEK
ncbi:translation initiation factor IF-5A [Candidatus Woesearchaeota archaeon]|nr:translation initiation factor IF-5A [Candidatus Woesearchaeota archaeon]